ncbi:protein arginine methyltransferase NDUFAF7, mitochondrial isoform X1 [Megalopta genalis]|uniref:protein arginine methyltransferase NDUFAF7, mitochondrial isoform X1 n=1 Tax=Megalopta genalis TaxID=115081 RepID=UPI003FD57784
MSGTFRKCMKNYGFLKRRVLLNCQKTNYLVSMSHYSSRSNEEELPNLYRHLHSKIVACGPITIAEYMREVLTHPTGGYYMNRDVFGEKGDFTTSPEITQLFGEMIAVWIVYEKMRIAKCPFQVVELGPGRGTLIKDILRVFKQLHILSDMSVHLVEISPALSLIQANNLCKTTKEHNIKASESKQNIVTYYREGVTEDNVNIYWYYSIKDIPKEFSIFLAHEFFDALPIHKFQRTDKGWNEVLVDIIEGCKEEKFRYVLSNVQTSTMLYISNDEKRDHVEVSPQTLATVKYIAQYLLECGGFALICDYGHNGDKTDTFRAFSQHKQQDPLSHPGTADLTADVDFSMISKVAEKDDKLITFGPITQASFLKNIGIDIRLQILLQNTSKEAKERLESEYHMIIDEDKMGNKFKFLSLFPSVLKDYYQKFPVTGFCDK